MIMALFLIKYVTVVAWLVGAALAVQGIYSGTDWPMITAAPVVAVGIIGAALAWAVLGWLECMLALTLEPVADAYNKRHIGIAATSAKRGEKVEVRL